MALYVKFAEEKKPRTIHEFLIKYYTNKTDTSPYASQVHANYTFLDKECTKLHSGHMRRSFDDLHEIVQTYFPRATPKMVFKRLLKLNHPDFKELILTNCDGMMRIRISLYREGQNRPSTYASANSVGKYKSKYSWKDLFEMVGITNQDEFEKYKNEK